jgi:xylulokinase
MTLVAGVDCSTQATKLVVCDAGTGEVVRTGRAPHPDGTEVDPRAWWEAWLAASAGLLDGVEALAVGGQQHGLVLTDTSGDPVRPALLWNDNRSAPQARALIDELGGPAAWAEATGVVPVASITVSKLRWVAEHEPELAARATHALLPHDYLTHRLRAEGEPTTDRGDASGTGYWSPAVGYRDDLLRHAFGREVATPRVAGPAEAVGTTTDGIVLGPGTGDNMAAALSFDLADGDVVVSLGTSGTVFATLDQATADPDGIVAGFADARGAFLPLVCTLNAARVLGSAATLAGVGIEDVDRLALSVECSDGLVLLPFLDGERTPPLPDAHGVLAGMTRHNMTPGHLVRAGIEGMLCGLGDAVDALHRHGVSPRRILLIGGASRSSAVQQIAAGLFGLPVDVPPPGEYVALGAARQAAWTLSGKDAPPTWQVAGHRVEPTGSPEAWARVRERYRDVLHRADPLLTEGGP